MLQYLIQMLSTGYYNICSAESDSVYIRQTVYSAQDFINMGPDPD